MFIKELEELQKTTEQLDLCLKSVYHLVDEMLNHPAKTYKITFKNRTYNLDHPFDIESKKENDKIRLSLIKSLCNYVISKRIRKINKEYDPKMYELFYSVCYGEDPKDHQIEKSTIEEIEAARTEKDEIYGKQRPLDEETYQVKMQNQKKVSFESDDNVT